VEFLAGEAGIRQFLDVGTGLPTAQNTHEVAQSIAPESRIVYVDNDPIVLAHARALLTSTPEGAATARYNARLGQNRITPRTREQIAAYFDGLDLVEPGLVPLSQWRAPVGSAQLVPAYAGVGRKR
jgi:hypothetical protein